MDKLDNILKSNWWQVFTIGINLLLIILLTVHIFTNSVLKDKIDKVNELEKRVDVLEGVVKLLHNNSSKVIRDPKDAVYVDSRKN